jgi:hypothetical protein
LGMLLPTERLMMTPLVEDVQKICCRKSRTDRRLIARWGAQFPESLQEYRAWPYGPTG